VGPEILKRQQDIYRRYRNTFRYLLGALDGFSKEEKLDYDSMPDLEKWVLHRLYELDQKVREAATSYDFKALYTELHTFCAIDLSAFYFDIRKDSLYCDASTDTKRRASRTVMDIVFECLMKWLAPVLCFTAEEAWLTRYPSEKGSVHLELFPTSPYLWNNPELAKKIEALRNIRKVMTGAIEVARNSKLIGSSLQAQLTLFLDPSLSSFIKDVDLAELSITSAVELKEESAPTDAFTLEDVDGVAVKVTLATGEKCVRCWKILPNVEELCCRCATVVESHGL
jgi:isoleucyl-tRNA synthetase